MAYDFGIPDFLEAELERFLQGLDALTDAGQRQARSRAARKYPQDPRPSSVTIPGYDDIIHIRPRPKPTPEQRKEYYDARRGGRAPNLAPELQDEIERRSRRARQIATSASPEYAKAWGQMMTAIDDVQDLLATLAALGRMTLNPAVRGLDWLAPEFGKAALLEAEWLFDKGVLSEAEVLAARRLGLGLGARTLGRLIPGIGWILTAADLLRLLNQLGLIAFPAYAAICGGPRAALAAGIPAAIMGPALKLRAGGLGKLNPFGRAARLQRSRAIREWRPHFYNVVEAVQTTDALFGHGAVFGGLVGAVQDGAFALVQRSQGKDVEINVNPWLAPIEKDVRFLYGKAGAAQTSLYRHAAQVLAYGPSMFRTQENFTVEEHIDYLVAFCAALSLLRPFIEHPLMVTMVNLALDAELEPPSYGTRELRAEMQDAGLPDTGFGLWPLPGSPARIRGWYLVESIAQEIPGALRALLEPRRETVEATLIGALVDRILNRSMILFTGSTEAVAERLQPHVEVMESLAMSYRWTNSGDTDAQLLGFFDRCIGCMNDTGRRSLGPHELDRFAEAAGATLLHATKL